MTAGTLRHRVTIERRSSGVDSVGQPVDTWTKSADVWASISPVTGNEFYIASGKRAEITHEIMLRHGVTLAPRDRILFDSRVFDVVSILNSEERNRMLDVKATEHAD